MPRRTIQFELGEHYHITNRGLGKKRIFYEHEDYVWFIERMRKFKTKHDVENIFYCLMPNHFHIITKQNQANGLLKFISATQFAYAKHFNHKWNRKGQMFEGRYYPKHIKDQLQLINTIKYLINNPVKAGLVEKIEDWPYTSCKLPTIFPGKFPGKNL